MINIAHYLRLILIRIAKLFSTYLVFFKIKWWKISGGKLLTAHGEVFFRKLPKSSIILGSHCSFNSRYNSNLIGVNRPCMISTLKRNAVISIGNKCGFSGTVIGAFESIIIGDNVRCGANTLITDSDWHEDDYRSGGSKPVVIGDGVWLGEGVKVMKGVCIGENSLIGVGSIVTKSIPANVVAAGNPCKVIKRIE